MSNFINLIYLFLILENELKLNINIININLDQSSEFLGYLIAYVIF